MFSNRQDMYIIFDGLVLYAGLKLAFQENVFGNPAQDKYDDSFWLFWVWMFPDILFLWKYDLRKYFERKMHFLKKYFKTNLTVCWISDNV